MSNAFSFSKIDQYARCPLAYKMINIDNIEGTWNNSIMEGKLAHRYMELSWKENQEDVKKILYQEYKDFNLVNQIIEQLKIHVPNIYQYCIGTEVPISFEVGPYEMHGVIDRVDNIDGLYKIIDYKYGNYEYDQNNLENSLQLSLYAYYIMNKYNVDKCIISYHNLKQNSIINKEITKNSIKIEDVVSFINVIKSSELLDDFPAKLSGNCINCVVRMSCEPFKNWISSSLPDIPDPDLEPEKLVEYYYNIQEKERYYKYQKKSLYDIINEIMKNSEINNKDYMLNYTKYGNIELKKL